MTWITLFALLFCSAINDGYSMKDEEIIQKFNKLEVMINAQIAVIQKQGETIQKQGETIQYQGEIIQKQGEEIQKGQKEVAERNVEHYSNSRSVRQTDHVAFTVYLDHIEDHLNDGQTIIFNKAVYNDGNHYNTASGIFNCRQSGVYLFAVYMGVVNSQHAVLKIVIEGRNQVDAIAESLGTGQDEQGGNMVITHVNDGESVLVAQYYETDGGVRGDPNYRFTTFSGVLLYSN